MDRVPIGRDFVSKAGSADAFKWPNRCVGVLSRGHAVEEWKPHMFRRYAPPTS